MKNPGFNSGREIAGSFDLAVIGGGAAGMLAAAEAARGGERTVLLEKNAVLGKKLRITGKGRCNITNNCGVRDFLENVTGNPRFLYSAANKFTPEDAIRYFEGIGVKTVTERGGRVFPASGSAHEVAGKLEAGLLRMGVTVLHRRVSGLAAEGGAVRAVKTEGGEVAAGRVILCTGGLSYPGTGSTGDGYAFAKAAGHTIVQPRASLVPLESDDGFCGALQGLTLKNIRLTALDESGGRVYSELGEMLFTHFGVSGPLVLSASAHMTGLADGRKYALSLDLKPGLDHEKLHARLIREFSENSGRSLKNVLGAMSPKAMIPVILEMSGVQGDTRASDITREQRTRLAETYKDFRVSVTRARPVSEAVVTAGGVDVREVNPRTMESKLLSGLYFAGEVLDLDAYTGGFNLQIAWSTAYTAARGSSRKEG